MDCYPSCGHAYVKGNKETGWLHCMLCHYPVHPMKLKNPWSQEEVDIWWENLQNAAKAGVASIMKRIDAEKWDRRFLELAKHYSEWSYDPSTKTGAVIVDKNKRQISQGYNGFAKGVEDKPERYEDRELKYKLILHSDMNALLFAKTDLTGCTYYGYPMLPCIRCAVAIIQSGITRVVAYKYDYPDRWKSDMDLSREIFAEASVDVAELDYI